MWSQMGECWPLLKFGRGVEVGNESLREVEMKEPREEGQVTFDILTPCYAAELEHNPNVLVLSIPQLYYSNLGGTWAPDSIISGSGFVFSAQNKTKQNKKTRAMRMTCLIVNSKP